MFNFKKRCVVDILFKSGVEKRIHIRFKKEELSNIDKVFDCLLKNFKDGSDNQWVGYIRFSNTTISANDVSAFRVNIKKWYNL